MPTDNQQPEREYDFALVATGVPELTDAAMNALFEAGCDDATPSIQRGVLYLEFSRTAPSLKDAILSAIRDVQRSRLPVQVVQVDECNLVTASEIARRTGRSRQHVHQYINGTRGPGGFPPPACHISDDSPLWPWCAVSFWMMQHNLLPPEDHANAEVVAAINIALERHHWHNKKLLDEVSSFVESVWR